jgi:hypothetical protein
MYASIPQFYGMLASTFSGTPHVHAGCGGEFFMPRHFFALVVGKALPQWRDNRIEFGREARQR